jgi:hypothetical protein
MRSTRTSGIRWDRVGRIALLGTLAVIMLLYVSPARHWVEQQRTAGEHRQPEALEREARRLGMVRQGERSYVIENLPAR